MPDPHASFAKTRRASPAAGAPAEPPATVMPPVHRDCRPLYFNAPELRQIDQLLDIGGGPGFVASLLKEEVPRIRITVFDLPPVCEHALEIFRASGQSRDLGAHSGNFLADALPSGFPVMQLSHVIEMLPPELVLFLLRKIHAALPPFGRLIVYGNACDAMRYVKPGSASPHDAAPLSPHEINRYSTRQYVQWLRMVDFSTVQYRGDAAGNLFLTATK
ncbi:methyltransferase [Xylophilus sp. GOD-11R]|uniref:methyltransferase n=1 Tax=Xylophilus sp. GOD-11R TaxID=3089814 RepID=UPI00298C915C|nr:methyltransferase [Xylophilus sp. GOD-11R]WPB55049.1 methyltransferase [Xylophilus sp. GOD-11R]